MTNGCRAPVRTNACIRAFDITAHPYLACSLTIHGTVFCVTNVYAETLSIAGSPTGDVTTDKTRTGIDRNGNEPF